MNRAAFLFAAFSACGVHALAADREFSDVVRAISDECHASPTRIPFFGMVNAFTAVVHPAGTRHIDLAVFENLDAADRMRAGRIERALGDSWTPFVHVRSNRDRETVYVYMRQAGNDWKLLVVAMERHEATVVQLLIDMNAMARWVADPEHCARHWRGD
jgi:hypothetical protein